MAATGVDVDKRWSLEKEVHKLIDQTLQRSFPCLGERSMTYICEDEYGDYQCENVLSIWPKLREEGTELEGLGSVGKKIKIELEKRSDMIEGTPVIRNIGFVTFNLSGKWIAESLYKMLRYGIDTWAPELPVERVIVEIPNFESPIWNSIVGTEADNIRSSFIRHTLINMLEFSNVYVKSSEHESRRGVISSLSDIRIEEKDGDVVISTEVEGELEYLNFGKRNIEDISDSLKNLRYELEDEKADWIVSLTHVRHQEFVEMCFAAAQHAGWIPTEEHRGLSFAGYRTHAEAGKLVNLLGKALTRCNTLVKQGKAAEYTAERVFTCTLGDQQYLKKHRMAECTFKVDEMLNEEGDTFLYLLNTKTQVLSVLENSRKDNHLKNVTKLVWEKIEVVEKDKGRALGLHLLMFTQFLKQSCLSVSPHILCHYLYNLSQKFTSYRSSCSCAPEFGSVVETTRLILCEATAAVMEKCFNLLGITPVSTFGQSFKEPLKLLLDLESLMGPKELFISRCDSVIPSSVRDPLKHSRLELVAICPRIARGSEFRRGKLIAHIHAEDGLGLLSDRSVSTSLPDLWLISLYDRAYDSGFIYNHGLVSIGNPNARHSVPLTKSTICISAELLVTSEREDDFVHFMSEKTVKMSDFWNKEGEGECAAGVLMVGGDKNDGMSALMYFYLLKDAVDATLEMKFTNDTGLKLKGKVFAYYGNNFPYNADSIIKRFHRATLLEHDTDLVVGQVPLTRSKMAVPKDGSLLINAVIINAETKDVVLEECHELFAKIEGDSTYSFTGDSFSLDLKVDWKY